MYLGIYEYAFHTGSGSFYKIFSSKHQRNMKFMSNKKEIYFYYKKLLSFLERWKKQMKKKKNSEAIEAMKRDRFLNILMYINEN